MATRKAINVKAMPRRGSLLYSRIRVFFGMIFALIMSEDSHGEFLPPGRMTLGVNYWASHAATEMWRKWDAKVVDDDLRVLAENGRAKFVGGDCLSLSGNAGILLIAEKFVPLASRRLEESTNKTRR